MDIGLVLPTIGPGASRESLEIGAETATRLGWRSVWATDHLMVPKAAEAEEYGTILEAIVALTHVAARYQDLVIGTSAIVPPMRNSVILAKELATLDILSQGRLIVAVGVADSADLPEFRNLGAEDRMTHRGAIVDETIRLWRHLWSGGQPPFQGRYHRLDDYVFLPLPSQGGDLPIWSGGRSRRAVERAATLADGYHAARTSPDDLERLLPSLRSLSEAAGRPMPVLSVRARVQFDVTDGDVYAFRGSASAMRRDVERFADLGVAHVIVVLEETEPTRIVEMAERFQSEVVTAAVA